MSTKKRTRRVVGLTVLVSGALALVAACIGDPPPVASRSNPEAGSPSPAGEGGNSSDGGVVLPAHCSNGARDESETDTDCGGECATCSNDQVCKVPLDCASGACNSGKCGPWGRVFGSTNGDDSASTCRFDSAGDLVVVGSFVGGTDFGEGSVGPAGASDGFVAKYSRTGELIWLKTFGAGGLTDAYGLAIAPNGDIAVSGRYVTPFGVDGSFVPNSNGGYDAFVVILDSAGRAKQVKGFGGAGEDTAGSLAFDASGDLFVAGGFSGPSLTLDGFVLPNAEPGSNSLDFFVAKLQRASLGALWARGFGSQGDAGTLDLVGGIDAVGSDVVLSCQYFGGSGLSLGGPLMPNNDYWDICIGRLDGADGGFRWGRHVSAGFNDLAGNVAVDSSGNILFAGTIEGNGDFGTGGVGPLMKPFLAKYAADGGALWTRIGRPPAGSSTASYGQTVAVDSAGNSVIGGTFLTSSMDFGGDPVLDPPDSGGPDPFVAAYDPSGATTFAKTYFKEGSDPYSTYRPALDARTGNTVLCGSTADRHDFGTGLLPVRGAHDILLVSLGRLHSR